MTTSSASIAFSGDIPAHYDTGLGPMFFEPYALDLAHLISRLAPQRVLELACGTGRITRLLPAVLPGGSTIRATDINPAMLAYARSAFPHPAVEWQQADAVKLPFTDHAYDVVVSGFGVMFYSDRISAYRETLRVLERGGAFVFTCWDDIQYNPMAALVNETLQHFFPDDTPAFYKIPFSYFDEALIDEELRSAGFTSIDIRVKSLTGYNRSAMNAANGLIKGTPAITAIEERAPEKVGDVLAHLERRISSTFGEFSLQVPLQARVVTAIKP